MTKTKQGMVTAVGAVFFAVMSVVMIGLFLTDRVARIDQLGFGLATAIRSEGVTSFFSALTYLGNAVVLAPLGVVLIVGLFVAHLRAEAVTLILTLGGGELLNELFKAVFARPRPDDFHLILLPDSFSFPSGHAMIAPAFYCMLAYLLSRWQEGRAWASLIQPVIGLMVVLLATSRVYLGVHYPSDVLAGFFLAMSGYLAVRFGYERHQENKHTPVRPILPSS